MYFMNRFFQPLSPDATTGIEAEGEFLQQFVEVLGTAANLSTEGPASVGLGTSNPSTSPLGRQSNGRPVSEDISAKLARLVKSKVFILLCLPSTTIRLHMLWINCISGWQETSHCN